MSESESESAGPAGEESTDEILETALKHRRGRRAGTSLAAAQHGDSGRFADIEGNPFHQVIIAERDPEAVKQAVAVQLAYDVEKERGENRASLVAFETFRAWLMEQRKDMAQQIIDLSDTDAFSELKDVFDDMTQGMLDFEQQMKPLTETLDAVYRLRMASDGEILEVLREIQEDREEEAQIEAMRKRQNDELKARRTRVSELRSEIAELETKKAWFGLGQIKEKARQRIDEIEGEIAAEDEAIRTLMKSIDAARPTRDSRFGEFAEDKAKLRELLDIGSEEHRRRQEALVESANRFVEMAQSRTRNVLRHLEGINEHVERLSEGNGRLREIYAVITEAVEDAEAKNTALRDELLKAPESETTISAMKRTSLTMAVEDHVTALISAKADTIETHGDLTAESYRIKSIRDSNNSQVAKTRALSTKGVAGVASRLSTVLQGVSTAALAESSEVARQTLARMNEQTTRFSHKEALKNAMAINAENDALVTVIDELEGYVKVARAATDISRGGLEEMRANLAKLQGTVDEVSEAVREAVAVSAEVVAEQR